jgi:hypothetical protein
MVEEFRKENGRWPIPGDWAWDWFEEAGLPLNGEQIEGIIREGVPMMSDDPDGMWWSLGRIVRRDRAEALARLCPATTPRSGRRRGGRRARSRRARSPGRQSDEPEPPLAGGRR